MKEPGEQAGAQLCDSCFPPSLQLAAGVRAEDAPVPVCWKRRHCCHPHLLRESCPSAPAPTQSPCWWYRDEKRSLYKTAVPRVLTCGVEEGSYTEKNPTKPPCIRISTSFKEFNSDDANWAVNVCPEEPPWHESAVTSSA